MAVEAGRRGVRATMAVQFPARARSDRNAKGASVQASRSHVIALCAFYAPADWRGAPYYQLSLDEHQ